MNCIKCRTQSDVDDASYCIKCGWPLVQPCPYCEQQVGLLREGRPTPKCPHCKQVFAVCPPPCGRLHQVGEQKCLNEGNDLVATCELWANQTGGPSRTHTIQWPALPSPDRVRAGPNELTGEIFGLVATGRCFYYAWREPTRNHAVVKGISLDGDDFTWPDLGIPARVDDALVAVRDATYYIDQGGWHRLDGTGRRESFDGTIIAQASLGDHWGGVVVGPSGVQIRLGESTLGELPSDFDQNCFALLSDFGPTWISRVDGTIWRADAGRLLKLGGSDQPVVQAWAFQERIYALTESGLLSSHQAQTGELIHQWRINGFEFDTPAVMIGDYGYIFHDDGQFSTFYIHGGTPEVKQHSYGRVNQVAGMQLESADEGLALVSGRTQEGRQIAAVGLTSCRTHELYFKAHATSKVLFALADQTIAVAVSAKGDVRVRMYGQT